MTNKTTSIEIFFEDWKAKINNIETNKDFEALALECFRFQYQNNPIYKQWCDYICDDIKGINSIDLIPFLPISFFKSKKVSSLPNIQHQDYFLSSGTASMQRSTHFIYDKNFYIANTFSCFQQFFDNVEDFCYICLLPNYLEQKHSSLICMMDAFIRQSKFTESKFYKTDFQDVIAILEKNESENRKTILFGVTYALLDLIETKKLQLKNTIVFETGGMKGRRKEISKPELHNLLKQGFGVEDIASEYGMCELFSQAYSKGDGIFRTPKQMQVLIREVNDRKSENLINHTGIINIIDLANIGSCAFIETEDVGRMHQDGSFEIAGRLDNSAMRGCNLMYSN